MSRARVTSLVVVLLLIAGVALIASQTVAAPCQQLGCHEVFFWGCPISQGGSGYCYESDIPETYGRIIQAPGAPCGGGNYRTGDSQAVGWTIERNCNALCWPFGSTCVQTDDPPIFGRVVWSEMKCNIL
jgi:hypothetical protein